MSSPTVFGQCLTHWAASIIQEYQDEDLGIWDEKVVMSHLNPDEILNVFHACILSLTEDQKRDAEEAMLLLKHHFKSLFYERSYFDISGEGTLEAFEMSELGKKIAKVEQDIGCHSPRCDSFKEMFKYASKMEIDVPEGHRPKTSALCEAIHNYWLNLAIETLINPIRKPPESLRPLYETVVSRKAEQFFRSLDGGVFEQQGKEKVTLREWTYTGVMGYCVNTETLIVLENTYERVLDEVFQKFENKHVVICLRDGGWTQTQFRFESARQVNYIFLKKCDELLTAKIDDLDNFELKIGTKVVKGKVEKIQQIQDLMKIY